MERVSKSGKWEEGISQIQSRDEPCPEAGHDQRCIRIPTLGTRLSTKKKKKRKKFLSRTPNLPKQNLWLCRERISIFNQLPRPFVCMLTFELRIWGWGLRPNFRFTAGSVSKHTLTSQFLSSLSLLYSLIHYREII